MSLAICCTWTKLKEPHCNHAALQEKQNVYWKSLLMEQGNAAALLINVHCESGWLKVKKDPSGLQHQGMLEHPWSVDNLPES